MDLIVTYPCSNENVIIVVFVKMPKPKTYCMFWASKSMVRHDFGDGLSLKIVYLLKQAAKSIPFAILFVKLFFMKILLVPQNEVCNAPKNVKYS